MENSQIEHIKNFEYLQVNQLIDQSVNQSTNQSTSQSLIIQSIR